MEKVVIPAEKREVVGKKVKTLRREGKLPAVIYGYGIDPISISLDAHSSSRTLARASSSTLITIELEAPDELRKESSLDETFYKLTNYGRPSGQTVEETP